MNSAPCGEPTPPNASTGDVGVKAAALVGWARDLLAAAGRSLPLFDRCILPSRRPSRLDDPPERPDGA